MPSAIKVEDEAFDIRRRSHEHLVGDERILAAVDLALVDLNPLGTRNEMVDRVRQGTALCLVRAAAAQSLHRRKIDLCPDAIRPFNRAAYCRFERSYKGWAFERRDVAKPIWPGACLRSAPFSRSR
jgi:hypothetical protein